MAYYRKTSRDSRPTFETRIADAKQQVFRIQSTPPSDNDTAVVMFMADRFPVDSIIPRVTVLPFDAWLAFGRHVKKGETSTRITVWVPVTEKVDGVTVTVTRAGHDGEEARPKLRPVDAKVFHVAQTEAYDRHHPDFWEITPEMADALALCTVTPEEIAQDAQEEPAPAPLAFTPPPSENVTAAA